MVKNVISKWKVRSRLTISYSIYEKQIQHLLALPTYLFKTFLISSLKKRTLVLKSSKEDTWQHVNKNSKLNFGF